MTQPADLLDRVYAIAQQASERILQVYASADLGVSQKLDDSPVTRADMAAHHCIVDGLRALTPEIPVLSEEDADVPFDTRRRWTRYWLVDPLDGTKEFIKRETDFTVNVALIEDGYPVLGVVIAPVLGVGYRAAVGVGCFEVRGGESRRVHTRRSPAVPVYLVSRSHKNPALAAFLSAAPPHEALSRGSSLKFCQIASGEADFHPRTGPTSEWDTAAGQCVAEQAGALVLQVPEQTRLRYNQKESLLNPLFAVIGDPASDWACLLAKMGA